MIQIAHLPVIRDAESRQAYSDCVTNWALRIRNACADATIDGVLWVADWNQDFRVPSVRVNLGASMIPARLTWRHHLPARGTHGSRVIDGSYSDLEVRSIGIIDGLASSDHRPYREVLLFPPLR